MEIASNNRDCYLSWAAIIFRTLKERLKGKNLPPVRRQIVLPLSTRLMMTHDALKSMRTIWAEVEVDKACQVLLHDFASMSVWMQRWLSNGSKTFKHFSKKKNDTDLQLKENSIIAFFEASDTEDLIRTMDNNCSRLYKLVCPDRGRNSLPANFNPSFQNYLIDFGSDLFNALELHIKCNPKNIDRQDDHKIQEWHPARLCLLVEKCDSPSISLLISSMQMAYWQDFHLTREPKKVGIEYNSSSGPAFCNMVDQRLDARAKIGFNPSTGQFQLYKAEPLETEPGPGSGKSLADVLLEFQLRLKDKVILAYAIAQAYYHFYDSDLLRIKWTSESIWFMPPTMENDEIPLRPYLKFPFGTRNDPEEDFIEDVRLVHHHPRILAIAILLLEIGLSKPFQSIPRHNSISQANFDYKMADNWLKELKETTWDGFANKSIFDKAIEYCLRDGRMLVDTQNKLGPVGTVTNVPTKTLQDKQRGILAQRDKFYKNVVLPLRYLAENGVGYKIENKLCIRKKPSLNTELPSRDELSQLEASFHSGNTVKPENWLRDLNTIGRTIAQLRRRHGMKSAIRVAILDTGIYEYANDNDSRPNKHHRDFVDGAATKMTDTFGHGTLMAKLVTSCAPCAEIFIARVARSTEELEGSQENIKDAIIWAGIECQADIISMSFGFPKDHEGIDTAIRAVQSERSESALFLASAGNSPFECENFPARHSSVISIQAANCSGNFMDSNPRLPEGAPAAWGTYGSKVPDKLFADIQERHPGVCYPGSSIATAVAAGISATMIAYADLLPHLEPSVKDSHGILRLKLLRRKSGMEALFKSMVKKNDGSRQWFIDPISFWRDTSDHDSARHFTRYAKIHSCLQDVCFQQTDIS